MNIKNIFLFLAILFTPTLSAQVNAEQVMTIGRNVLSMDDYILSIHYFNLAIKAKPYLSEPYYYRGLAKLMLDDFKGAEEDCTLAIERNKFLAEAYRVRGFARQRLDKDSLAITDYDKGLEYMPIDKLFLYYKGAAQTTIKDYEGADSTFRLLMRYFPRFEGAYTERARLNVLRGDTLAAMADLDTSILINKNEPYPYLIRSEISAKRQNWEPAKDDMDKAIELLPKEPSLYLNRAYLRYNTDDYFGAMSDYNYTLELDPENMAAYYNRALLRYEVHDMNNSAADFSKVLAIDPTNFHALYSLGLIYLEQGKNKEAVSNFKKIADKYPKFYPVYYAMAQAKQNMGDMRGAMSEYKKAEDLVRGYVSNPQKNPLDKPTITAGTSNSDGMNKRDNESEEDVMNRFNQLVTVSSNQSDSELSFNDKIKGKIQDRDMKVEPEPVYAISLYSNMNAFHTTNNYFKELDELNSAGYLQYALFLSPNVSTPSQQSEIERLFNLVNSSTESIQAGMTRPVDYLNRGILYFLLKNYDDALTDFDKALSGNDEFTVAYMARAYAYYTKARVAVDADKNQDAVSPTSMYQLAMADYDKALALNPRLIYAWFNKGTIYYQLEDYTSALRCFNEAIAINPDFAEAYYNRGITYLRLGNKASGTADLSKAGELGILPSYNLLKKMN